MRLFGLEITKAASPQPVHDRGWYRVMESFSGAWQKNVEIDHAGVLAFHAVFSCMTLIASDIAKLRVKLVQKDADGIWGETTNPAYSPLLRKPNHFQTRNQFWETWVLSKLSRGNTYALKQRDNRGVVTALYVLDPARVRPMVTPAGNVFYELQADNLAGLQGDPVMVPASEIIHDRFNCLHHPLVGQSPIYANGLAATQGIRIQTNSAKFFGNGSKPGGLLVAPGRIDPENATRLKEYWDQNFTGDNAGKIAVLGDGLRYEGLSVKATDAQLIEQLKWTAEVVCATFHVPPYKLGIGNMPTASNVQSLNLEYYTQCLQALMEAIEECLDEGLGIGWDKGIGTEFDLDGLLRMDSVTQMDVIEKSKNVLTLDERRRRLDAPKITGGNTVYLQQQDHSIEAIAARDKQLIDAANAPEPVVTPEPANDDTAAQRATDKKRLTLAVRGLVNAD